MPDPIRKRGSSVLTHAHAQEVKDDEGREAKERGSGQELDPGWGGRRSGHATLLLPRPGLSRELLQYRL